MLNVNTRFAIIKGVSSCGKSTSIILFIRELMETDEFRFICNRDSQRYHTILNSLDLNKKTKDLQCSILYKNKLIYITTFGDDATELNKRFCEHNGYADIIVCAGRPNDNRHKKFQELYKNWSIQDMDCIVKEKCTEPAEINRENLVTAQLLKKKIDALIKEM